MAFAVHRTTCAQINYGGALTALAAEPADTPVMQLFREWQAITDLIVSDAPMTEANLAEGTERRYALKDQILALPCLTPQDFIAKIVASTTWGAMDLEDDGTPELWAEARQLLGAA